VTEEEREKIKEAVHARVEADKVAGISISKEALAALARVVADDRERRAKRSAAPKKPGLAS
jgi:hypothetical protein